MIFRTRFVEIAEVAIVVLAIWRRHQHLDVLTDHLAGAVFEQFLAGRIEHQHAAVGVDQDDPADGGIHHRTQQRRINARRPRRWAVMNVL